MLSFKPTFSLSAFTIPLLSSRWRCRGQSRARPFGAGATSPVGGVARTGSGLPEPYATSGAGTTLAPPLPSPVPCDWRKEPSLGRAVGVGGRGPRPKVTRWLRRCGERSWRYASARCGNISGALPQRPLGRSPSALCGEWRRDGTRGERRQRGGGRAPAADPQPEAGAAGGQRDAVPQLHLALLLPRDVVWCVPVGTGVFSLLSRPRRITGPLHPQTSQIWCSNCWSVPSSRKGNDSI